VISARLALPARSVTMAAIVSVTPGAIGGSVCPVEAAPSSAAMTPPRSTRTPATPDVASTGRLHVSSRAVADAVATRRGRWGGVVSMINGRSGPAASTPTPRMRHVRLPSARGPTGTASRAVPGTAATTSPSTST